jgi:exopolysaccharide production protein ExoZ
VPHRRGTLERMGGRGRAAGLSRGCGGGALLLAAGALGVGKMARLLTLQVARGVAANLVILYHLTQFETIYAGKSILPAFCFYGMSGVDIFFVLSGFIMVAVAGKGIGAVQFLWRRAIRIYPPYWLVTLVVLEFSNVGSGAATATITLWRSFLLVPDSGLPLLTVGWTLIHEVYFYLVFAVLLALRIPIPVGLLGWGLVLLIVTIFGGDFATSPFGGVWTNPLTAEFMMGAAIGVLYDHRNMPGAAYAGAVGFATFAGSIVFLAPALQLDNSTHLDAWRVVLFGIPAALIVYWLAAWEQKAPRMPPRLLVALGDWSYATYLMHVLVLSALGHIIRALALSGAMSNLMLIVVGVLAANLAGAVMFRFFERPMLGVLHRFGSTVFERSKRGQVVTKIVETRLP